MNDEMTLSLPRPFNLWLVAAGALMLFCAAIHAFLGGPEVNAPVQAAALDPVVRAVSAVVWHALTALFLVFGAALIWLARNPSPPLFWTILAVNLSFIAIFLVIGFVELGSVTLMPQWTLFLAISLLMMPSLRNT